MIIYEDLCGFHAPPGTEVVYITSLMQMIGLGNQSFLGALFSDHSIKTDLPTFTLVNHPCQWLENCFRWGIFNLPMMHIVVPPAVLKTDCFYEFVKSIYGHSTDIYGRLHRQYKSDVTIRTEDLPWCLFELLESLGTIISKKNVPPLSKKTVYDDGRTNWTKELRELVRNSEQRMFEDYEYF